VWDKDSAFDAGAFGGCCTNATNAAYLACVKSRQRSKQYIVVVVRAVLTGARRVGAALGPPVQRVIEVVVRVTGGEGENAEVVAVHVALAALSTGVLMLASACVDPGTSTLLKTAGACSVGLIAVHAAWVIVRRSGAVRRSQARPLIAAAVARLPERHAAAHALAIACEPQQLWGKRTSAVLAAQYVLSQAFSSAVIAPAKELVPGISQALDVMGAYQKTLANARFVRQFAQAATEAYAQLPA
jgi:hypothetical protein